VSPYCALFGVDPFEFDACLCLELRLQDEPHDVAQLLADVQGQLYKKAMRCRAAGQVQYYKAVKICLCAVGDRVMIYHILARRSLAGYSASRGSDLIAVRSGIRVWALCGERVGRQESTRPSQPFEGGTVRSVGLRVCS
jgi:hypothetical protein